MKTITSMQELEAHYGEPSERSLWKEIDYINHHYQQFIEKSPFLILATSGKKGIDCSPRGDPAGFVRVVDEKHIQIPDRRGNNRIDSLRNIIDNPNVGVLFLVPNVGETIRLCGKAEIIVDEALCQSFAIDDKPAKAVISIRVEKAYYQCQKAIARSSLWDSSTYIARSELPSGGDINKFFSDLKNLEFDVTSYDKNYPEYLKRTIY